MDTINSGSKDQLFISRLAGIIHANLANENFGVNELVAQSGLSHYMLSKKLHAMYGRTIVHFISETRLRKSLEMLQNEEMTIAEIAYRSGFGSATYFTASFTEFFGFPPGQVKNGVVKVTPELTTIALKPESKRKRSSRIYIYSIGSVIVALIILFHIFYLISANENSAQVRQPANSEKSIAVIPIKNLSDSAGNNYFAEGLTEDILMHLSRINDLKVVSRLSVEQFPSGKFSATQLAKKLKVNYIIEGSVQKAGNTCRLWIQLLDAESAIFLISEVFEAPYSQDMFEFQSSTVKIIAAKVQAAVTSGKDKSINAVTTTDNFYRISPSGKP